ILDGGGRRKRTAPAANRGCVRPGVPACLFIGEDVPERQFEPATRVARPPQPRTERFRPRHSASRQSNPRGRSKECLTASGRWTGTTPTGSSNTAIAWCTLLPAAPKPIRSASSVACPVDCSPASFAPWYARRFRVLGDGAQFLGRTPDHQQRLSLSHRQSAAEVTALTWGKRTANHITLAPIPRNASHATALCRYGGT